MSDLTAMIRLMRAKGIACNVILDAVEALTEAKDHEIEERRATDRVRKARQRAALKEQQKRHVTSADISDISDTKTPPPLSSPPLPPTPPNTPPIIPPASVKSDADEPDFFQTPKAKPDPKGSRLSADWTLPADWAAWAKSDQGLTAKEISDEADKFRDFWIGKPGAGGRKLDWIGTWRNWIRRAAPEIAQRRARAQRDVQRAGNSNGNRASNPHEAVLRGFAKAAGIETGDRVVRPDWNDDGDGAGELFGSRDCEVLDRDDPRGADARLAAGDRLPAGAVVLPLSRAGGR